MDMDVDDPTTSRVEFEGKNTQLDVLLPIENARSRCPVFVSQTLACLSLPPTVANLSLSKDQSKSRTPSGWASRECKTDGSVVTCAIVMRPSMLPKATSVRAPLANLIRVTGCSLSLIMKVLVMVNWGSILSSSVGTLLVRLKALLALLASRLPIRWSYVLDSASWSPPTDPSIELSPTCPVSRGACISLLSMSDSWKMRVRSSAHSMFMTARLVSYCCCCVCSSSLSCIFSLCSRPSSWWMRLSASSSSYSSNSFDWSASPCGSTVLEPSVAPTDSLSLLSLSCHRLALGGWESVDPVFLDDNGEVINCLSSCFLLTLRGDIWAVTTLRDCCGVRGPVVSSATWPCRSRNCRRALSDSSSSSSPDSLEDDVMFGAGPLRPVTGLDYPR
eukprot:comp18972_c0_seq1/m.21271 comp18972_c0_seq1/g.21271  ORF comp18972_c0_seq1/g.21271 comp18972_c0_seq1/m.21271 type:complete len:389 (+) comp18972_c0_seq1:1386-2552(+)